MKKKEFNQRMAYLIKKHDKLINRRNKKLKKTNGIYDRYKYPVDNCGTYTAFLAL